MKVVTSDAQVDLDFNIRYSDRLPIAFNKEHRNMLAYAKELMEYGNGVVAIDPKHNKLITALRTAVEKGEGTLDKEPTSHDDLFDTFRMSLQYWVTN